MVDGNGLENRRGATHREFESRPLRQEKRRDVSPVFFLTIEEFDSIALPLISPSLTSEFCVIIIKVEETEASDIVASKWLLRETQVIRRNIRLRICMNVHHIHYGGVPKWLKGTVC